MALRYYRSEEGTYWFLRKSTPKKAASCALFLSRWGHPCYWKSRQKRTVTERCCLWTVPGLTASVSWIKPYFGKGIAFRRIAHDVQMARDCSKTSVIYGLQCTACSATCIWKTERVILVSAVEHLSSKKPWSLGSLFGRHKIDMPDRNVGVEYTMLELEH